MSWGEQHQLLHDLLYCTTSPCVVSVTSNRCSSQVPRVKNTDTGHLRQQLVLQHDVKTPSSSSSHLLLNKAQRLSSSYVCQTWWCVLKGHLFYHWIIRRPWPSDTFYGCVQRKSITEKQCNRMLLYRERLCEHNLCSGLKPCAFPVNLLNICI